MATTREIEQLLTDGLCATSNYVALHSLLSSGDYSDMTIRCRGREFKTHRAVVCSQSPFFKTALSSNFKESISGTVDLPDDDPEIVYRFLEFLYTGTYSVDDSNHDMIVEAAEATKKHIPKRLSRRPEKSNLGSSYVRALNAGKYRWSPYAFKASSLPTENDNEKTRESTLKQSIQIYALADKYGVPALQLLARDRFFELGQDFLSAATRWDLASWEDTAFFSEIVEMIYDNTFSEQDPLRQALCMIIGKRTGNDVMKKRMRKEMMLKAELAVGVVDSLKEAKSF